MHIIVNNDTLYKLTGSQTTSELKNKLQLYFEKQLCAIDLVKDTIRNIIILKIDENNARVEKVNIKPIEFDIYIQDYIIWYLYDKSKNKGEYANAVIVHELLHCKDVCNINSKIDINIIEKDSLSLQDLYINLGFHQWSEYYAHYYSAKIHKSDIIISKIIISELYDEICKFRKEILFNDSNSHFVLYERVIHPFIKAIIMLLANINSIGSKEHMDELLKYQVINFEIQDYIEKINSTITKLFDTYPQWISYDIFLDLGKVLLEI